jgi:hypothetical protein
MATLCVEVIVPLDVVEEGVTVTGQGDDPAEPCETVPMETLPASNVTGIGLVGVTFAPLTCVLGFVVQSDELTEENDGVVPPTAQETTIVPA